MQARAALVLTVGHSTRPMDEFVALLRAHGVQRVVDVRTVPRSRRHPHYNTDALAAALPDRNLAYEHMPGLGGFRRPRADSPNTAWHNDGFRGYADYMQSEEFIPHVERLIALARRQRTAVMCAEAVPWRCHRSLLADALLVRGVRVFDITGRGAPRSRQ